MIYGIIYTERQSIEAPTISWKNVEMSGGQHLQGLAEPSDYCFSLNGIGIADKCRKWQSTRGSRAAGSVSGSTQGRGIEV